VQFSAHLSLLTFKGQTMKTYKLFIVRKFYEPIEVEAEDHHEAEDKGYEFISANNLDGKYDSDDTYIYLEGEK
jgi:hypothetical protein